MITVAGTGSWQTSGAGYPITDSYIPSGARSFHVADAGAIAVGQSVLVQRPVTEAWIEFMGMADLWRDDAAQTWLAPGTIISADRKITAIAGDVVTVDAPYPTASTRNTRHRASFRTRTSGGSSRSASRGFTSSSRPWSR